MSAYNEDDVRRAVAARKTWLRNESDERTYLEAVVAAVAPAIAARAWDEGHEAGIAAEHDGFPTQRNPYDETEQGGPS